MAVAKLFTLNTNTNSRIAITKLFVLNANAINNRGIIGTFYH